MGCPGGCPGNTQTFTGHYRESIPGRPVQTLSHGSCEGVTIDLLNMYQRLIDCVKTHNIYSQVQVTEAEIDQAKVLLTSWISAKEADPASCEYQEKFPVMQAIINRIVAFGQC